MKKFLFTFIFVMILLPGVVDARTTTGLSYDANEHFNYFYEQKNNTPFYNFLVEKGDDLPSFLGVNYNTSTISKLFIFYADELKFFYDDNLTNYPEDAKYVIVYTSRDSITLKREGTKYTYTYSSISDFDYFWFDSSAKLISKAKPTSSGIMTRTYDISDTSIDSSANFSYFISSLYLSRNYIPFSPKEEIVVTDIITDGERYLIDDNANYNSFIASIRKFFSFGGIKDYTDIVDTNISYFKNYPFTSDTINVRSLYNLISYGRNIKVPDGFSTLTLDSDNWGYIFIPKNVNNVDLDRKLYTSTTESIYIDKLSVWLNVYSLEGNKYKTPYDDTKLAKLKYDDPFTLYRVDVSKELNKLNSDYKLTDYIIALTLQNYKYKSSIYYNPDSYVACSAAESCTFINPLTNQEVTLTKDDIYNVLSSNDSTGASVDIFSPADEQLEYAKEYSELYEYDDEGNIKGFNVSSILKSISVFLTSFIGVITGIFSYFTLFFNALPVEIRSLLYFLLIGGILIILFKFMRG